MDVKWTEPPPFEKSKGVNFACVSDCSFAREAGPPTMLVYYARAPTRAEWWLGKCTLKWCKGPESATA